MTSRAPWWMWLLYASFVFYAAFVVYSNVSRPEDLGASFKFTGGHMVLLSVQNDAPAARAGLRPGDVIVRAAGIRIGGLASWIAARAQVELNVPQSIEVEREGKRFPAELLSLRRMWSSPVVPGFLVPVMIAMKVMFFVLAFLILWYRPRDKVAVIAAWLIASGAAAAPMITTGMAVSFRQLPAPLALVLVFPFFCNVSGMTAALFTFCALFPRRLFRSPWPYVVAWTPMTVIFLGRVLPFFYRVVYRPEALRDGAPETSFHINIAAFLLLAVVAVVVLLLNYRRLEDVNERRRVRVVVAGFAVSWACVVPMLYALNVSPSDSFRRVLLSPLVATPMFLLMMAAPCSVAYAVLRHRVFDIRVIVRQGLRYAVARYVLAGLVPAMALLLVADLLLHRGQTVAQMLGTRAWIYAGIAAAAWFAHSRREQWLNALDRHFFRERYDAQRLLREVLDDARRAASLDDIAETVVAKLEAALHPEYATLLVREAEQVSYKAIACAPVSAARLELAAEVKLLGLVRLLEKPVEISGGEASWLAEQLPHNETEWLRDTRVDLIIPVAFGPTREALLVLGPKRSEEPYSGEDKEFLLSVAGSLRLLLERPAVPLVASDNSFRECPQCGLCAGSALSTCPSDNSPLTVMGAPQLLAGRYRLERRIGRGGMGSVYAARDTALERQVAVKLVREELVGSPSAAHRFQQEARAAAAFTHPNVVAIYDYGVAGARAFLIMELLQGRSLREEIQRNGPLPAERLLELFRGVCGAVETAHRRGMVHRDLKPENIFLAQGDEGESAKILDFGLVKAMTDETQLTADTAPGAAVGTALYFSPEQWRGEPPDADFDCWALAVTLYEALCGQHPFPAATREGLRRKVLSGQYQECKDEGWAPVFRRAFAVDRTQRPASPQALYAEFERALQHPGALATQGSSSCSSGGEGDPPDPGPQTVRSSRSRKHASGR